MSLFVHTLSTIGSNNDDNDDDDYQPSEISINNDKNQVINNDNNEDALDDETNQEFKNVIGHENKVRWLERKLHEQSMLVADLSSYGVSAPAVEVERRKLRVLELMRFKEFRQTMLEKLKRKTTTVVAGKRKENDEKINQDLLKPASAKIDIPRPSTESVESTTEEGTTKSSTTNVDERVDMNIDVQINIESGQCILRANPTNTVAVKEGQTLSKRPSTRDLKKLLGLKEYCITKLSIPSVNVKMFYTSNDNVSTTPENIKTIFKEQMKLKKNKNNCFYVSLELSSMPDETLVTPNLADFLEQVIEPLPENLFETNKNDIENKEEITSAAVPIVTSLDTSTLPLDVLFHMVVQSSTIRFEGQQQKTTAADCLLKLPRLALMASTRKLNDNSNMIGGIYLSATLSAFSLNIYSPHQKSTSHDALSLTLDKLSITCTRTKLPNDKYDDKNKVQLIIITNVGCANFNYDMRRLSELLAFPKPWYRKVLVKRLFFGDEVIRIKKESINNSIIIDNKKIINDKKDINWAASCVFTMQWKELNIYAQMSNTMGNTTLLARNGLLRGYVYISPKNKNDLALTFKLLSSELLSQGGAISGEISIKKLLISTRHSRIYNKSPENHAKLEFKQIENRIEWMSRPIFIGKFVDPKIIITDEWKHNTDNHGNVSESTCFVNISGSWTDLQMVITKMTVDDIGKISKKLQSFFGEQLTNSRLMWEAELDQQRKELLKRKGSMNESIKRDESEVSISSSSISDFTINTESTEKDENYLEPHWQRVLELITTIQLRKTFFPLPNTSNGITLTGGAIEFEAKSISVACMNGEMLAQNWALFHMRQASVDVHNTAKYTYLDVEKQNVGVNMEQKLIFRLGNGMSSFVDNYECKAVVLRVQHARNFMIRNNASIEIWLESIIGDALKQLSIFSDSNNPPMHAHNVLELFQFPALEAILTTIQNQPYEGINDTSFIVQSSFVCDFHSSVGVQTDFNAQLGFLPELIKSYIKTSNDSLSLDERKKDLEHFLVVEKKDPRRYECLRWVVDPKIVFIDRFKWSPPVIDDILRKLQIFDGRLTIPKVIQRGVFDRCDVLLSSLLENIVVKLALKEY